MLPAGRERDATIATVSSPSPSVRPDDTGSTRRNAWVGAVVGGVVAVVIILASSHGHVSQMTKGDGLIYRYVAAHLSTPAADIHPVVKARGTSLRYGRVGLPIAIWVASGGHPSAMQYAQPVVMVVSAAAACSAAALLFSGGGGLPALLPYLAPGFALSVAGGYAEALAVALALWAVVFAIRKRWVGCAVMLCGALLTRENAIAVLLGIAVWVIVRDQARALVALVASLIPVGAWYLFVKQRYGYIPPLDPYLRKDTDTVGTPMIALIHSFTRAGPTRSKVMAGIHVGLGAAAVALARWSLFGFIAVAATLQVLVSGPFAWHYIGEAARTAVFLQLFVVLAALAWLRPSWTQPQALTERGR